MPLPPLGRGLQPEEQAAGRGRSQPFSTAGIGLWRRFFTPGDALPMQVGRGAAQLPASVPLVGFARGLPTAQDRVGFGLARGIRFPVAEPKVGPAAEPPSLPGLQPHPGHGQPPEPVVLDGTEKKPENVAQGEVTARTVSTEVVIKENVPGGCMPLTDKHFIHVSLQFDLPSHGSPLVSMFRGIGLDPSEALRGQPPVGLYYKLYCCSCSKFGQFSIYLFYLKSF